MTDPDRLYTNDGLGNLTLGWTSEEAEDSRAVAWGDVDGDGDLDLAVGAWYAPNRVYTSEGGQLVLAWSSTDLDRTAAVAWGDVDGDGDLDLAVGNGGDPGTPNRVYLNNGGGLEDEPSWTSTEADSTFSVAWGDWDGDGDLDLAVGNGDEQVNRVYVNDGTGLEPTAAWSSSEAERSRAVAWADADGDGDLDLAVANWGGQTNRIYINHHVGPALLPQSPPSVVVGVPDGSPAVGEGFASASPLVGPTLVIPFTLADRDGDNVPRVQVQYSVAGGGSWIDADLSEDLVDLAADPEGTDHYATWDISSGSVRGDGVRVRVVAMSQAPVSVAAPVQRGAVASVGAPFRVYPTCFPVDPDGDGADCLSDCDDYDPSRYPEAVEICDLVDSDCDGDLVDGFDDFDGDGEPDCIDSDDDGDGDPDESDCAPVDAAVHSNQQEVCNGVDDDCDPSSHVEPGETDHDGDGVRPCEGDCDDDDPEAWPGRAEICDDEVDNDCDGTEAPGVQDPECWSEGSGCSCRHATSGAPRSGLLLLLALGALRPAPALLEIAYDPTAMITASKR